jgi:hypothetical protein
MIIALSDTLHFTALMMTLKWHLIRILHATRWHCSPHRGLIHWRCGSVWVQIRQQRCGHTCGVALN